MQSKQASANTRCAPDAVDMTYCMPFSMRLPYTLKKVSFCMSWNYSTLAATATLLQGVEDVPAKVSWVCYWPVPHNVPQMLASFAWHNKDI